MRLADAGPDRVRVSGIRGGPRPPSLKLSISYANGWKAIGTLVYSLAAGAGEGARGRCDRACSGWSGSGLRFDEIYTEYLRRERLPRSGRAAESRPARSAACASACAAQDKKAVDRFTRELIPLVLNGPPGATGFGEGRPPVREIVAYWPALVPREEIVTHIELVQ